MLKLNGSTSAPQSMPAVVAPAAKRDPFVARAVSDGAGFVCPLFQQSPAAIAAGETPQT